MKGSRICGLKSTKLLKPTKKGIHPLQLVSDLGFDSRGSSIGLVIENELKLAFHKEDLVSKFKGDEEARKFLFSCVNQNAPKQQKEAVSKEELMDKIKNLHFDIEQKSRVLDEQQNKVGFLHQLAREEGNGGSAITFGLSPLRSRNLLGEEIKETNYEEIYKVHELEPRVFLHSIIQGGKRGNNSSDNKGDMGTSLSFSKSKGFNEIESKEERKTKFIESEMVHSEILNRSQKAPDISSTGGLGTGLFSGKKVQKEIISNSPVFKGNQEDQRNEDHHENPKKDEDEYMNWDVNDSF